MKNIFKIFISDVKRIFQNVVAVVVIMGLCVIPCLYAWFNIFSNWDPYGESSTSNLKVAVVSEDEGVTVAGISVNIGSSVVEALQENKVMGWVFTETSDEAVDGVYSGEYYAALVIPDDFTEEMISFLGGQIEHPDIIYYENEKKNETDHIRAVSRGNDLLWSRIPFDCLCCGDRSKGKEAPGI